MRWEKPLDGNNKAFYLQRKEPEILRGITHMRVTGECAIELTEFRLREGTLGGLRVAWATGVFLGDESLLVASQGECGATELSISPAGITVHKEPAPSPD